jgi:hypothetical protein
MPALIGHTPGGVTMTDPLIGWHRMNDLQSVAKNPDLIFFRMNVFDYLTATGLLWMGCRKLLVFQNAFLTMRHTHWSHTSWKVHKFTCIRVSVNWWLNGTDNNTTPFSFARSVLFRGLASGNNTGLYFITIMCSIKCSMKNIKSFLASAVLLVSRRYHRNINKFQSACKRPDAKEKPTSSLLLNDGEIWYATSL